MERKSKTCSECGEKMTSAVLSDLDLYKCENPCCKYYGKWVPIPDITIEELEKKEKKWKPPLGIKPYYVFYPERIRELTEAINRYADKPYEHCVYDWLREIDILRRMYRGMEQVMKQREFYEEEMKVEKQ